VCRTHRLGLLASGCRKANQHAPPPPSKVSVARPIAEKITRYLEATGNTASVASVDLVARVQGFVQGISYTDGAAVKTGGQVLALTGLGVDNNLYTQIGLMLLIALGAKNAILIVEVAREQRVLHGLPILDAAVGAARARLRPILITSFAFILGVVPLVLASGAGANARKSIGISVSTGMLASTCLAVVFVPCFFVVMQRFEEWLFRRKAPAATGVA
jgi:HAE1 family hydrophobic/amphiphilic exporter-1